MPSLTPLSYLIVALICLLGIVQQWTAVPGTAPLPFWQLALAAHLAALTYEWVRTREQHLAVSIADGARLRLGRVSRMILQFDNPDSVALEIMYAPGLPEALNASAEPRILRLPADSRVESEVEVLPGEVGTQQWQRLPMRLLGPLNLAWWPHGQPMNAVLEVIPDLLGGRSAALGLEAAGASARQRPGTGQELHHLRSYRPGDPRHTIDWKATARTGELITRVFGEDQHLEIMLVLDLGRTSRTQIDGLSQLGHYLNLSARFAEHAVAHEDQVGLIAVTDRPIAVVPPGRGFSVVGRIREELLRLHTEPVETDLLVAARELARLVHHRAMIIVLTDLYGATNSGRLMQCVRLWVPQHLPMIVGLVGAELSELAEQPALDRLDPYTSLAARTYQADLHRGMRSLRQLGAQTLLARPRDLEHAVFNHYRQLRAQRRI